MFNSNRTKKTYSMYRQRPVPVYVSGSGLPLQVRDANRYSKTYGSFRGPARNAEIIVGQQPAVAPTVTAADPDVGDTSGTHAGVMTITGTDFISGATVTIGGSSASSVTFVNSTTLTCKPPALASGVHNIVVTNPDTLAGTLLNGYRAWTPAEITGIDGYIDSRKDVTLAGSNIASITEQSRIEVYSYVGTAANAEQPTLVTDSFGTGVPAIQFTKTANVTAGGAFVGSLRALASGASSFWCGKWTTSDETSDSYAGNPPQTMIGDSSTSVYNNFGAAGSTLERRQYVGGWLSKKRGYALNDGSTRLVGWTHDAGSAEIRAYVGDAQQGTTGYLGYDVTWNGWNTFGGGLALQAIGTKVADTAEGSFGAFVVVSGIITSTDLSRLQKWSRLSFNAAASPAADGRADALTGFWREYAGTSWPGTTSAGTSSTNNLSVPTGYAAPNIGTAVDGYTPAVFDGSTNLLRTSADSGTMFETNKGCIAIMYKADATIPVAAANVYDDPSMFNFSGGGYYIAGINSTGPRAGLYDGAYKEIQLTASTGNWHVFIMRWDGTNLYASIDGGAESSVACSGSAFTGFETALADVGANYSLAAFFKGEIMECRVIDEPSASDDIARLYAEFKAKYPSAGLP